jgi:hypothetical protein
MEVKKQLLKLAWSFNYGAVDKLVKSQGFQSWVCGFDPRQHCLRFSLNFKLLWVSIQIG